MAKQTKLKVTKPKQQKLKGVTKKNKGSDQKIKTKIYQQQSFDSAINDSDLSDIYDSQKDDISQNISSYESDQQRSQNQVESQNLIKDIESSFEEYEQRVSHKKDHSHFNSSAIFDEIENDQREKIKNQDQKRKHLEELQRVRVQRYLKKTPFQSSSVKQSDYQEQKIKMQSIDASSVVPQPSQRQTSTYDPCQSSQIMTQSSTIKHKKKTQSTEDKNLADSNLMQYLLGIMSGKISTEQIDNRKKQEEKKLALQTKIQQMKRKKEEDKLKKQFDTRSQSQMKVLSTNMDSCYQKLQDSFSMPLKPEKLENQVRQKRDRQANFEYATNGRKKRTRVSPQMLKKIIKEFQKIALQQNSYVQSKYRITFRSVGKQFNLGRSSVMKMYSDYCKDPTMKKRFQSRQLLIRNKPMMELTKRRITFVQKLIRNDCTLSQRQIAAQMNAHDDLKCKRKKKSDQTEEEYLKNPYHPIAYKAVSRLMKLGNFTRKKVTLIPKNRNSDRTLDQRYNFCKILDELIADSKNKLYFLDECRFNLFTSRDWGWAPKGELATKVRHNSKGKDVMLLAIIGKQGLVGYEVSDSYNRGSFTIAVNKLINQIIPETVPQGQKIYLILDNCPIHNKDNLKYLESTLPLTILYLPPYSPMLNPIESWFGQLKRIVKSKIYKTRQAMKKQLLDCLNTYKTKSLQHYYRGIEKYIALGLKKQLYRGNNKF